MGYEKGASGKARKVRRGRGVPDALGRDQAQASRGARVQGPTHRWPAHHARSHHHHVQVGLRRDGALLWYGIVW